MSNKKLVDAIRNQDINTIKKLLNKDTKSYRFPKSMFLNNEQIDLDYISGTGQTLLIEAINIGNTESVELLLDKGANPCMCDTWGNIPLLLAASKGNSKTVSLILESNGGAHKQELLTNKNLLEKTAFDLAVEFNHLNIALELYNQGERLGMSVTASMLDTPPLSFNEQIDIARGLNSANIKPVVDDEVLTSKAYNLAIKAFVTSNPAYKLGADTKTGLHIIKDSNNIDVLVPVLDSKGMPEYTVTDPIKNPGLLKLLGDSNPAQLWDVTKCPNIEYAKQTIKEFGGIDKVQFDDNNPLIAAYKEDLRLLFPSVKFKTEEDLTRDSTSGIMYKAI